MLKKVKEIVSKDGVLHFRRWEILRTRWFVINIHGIYHKDEDKHLHSHPWNFLSIVLWGSYMEELEGNKLNVRMFLNTAYRKAEAFHKIYHVYSKRVFTLNIMSTNTKPWGYQVDGSFVNHKEYRNLKNNKKV